jgi:hypothetical protein
LRGADLTQSVLEQAILWRADLQDAVLSGAHVREAHLERANLLRVSGLTWEQLEGAFADEGTVWPLELMREKAMEPIVPPEPLPRRRTVVRPAVRREAPTPMPPIPESLPRVSDAVERQGPNGAERQGADGANGRVRPSQPRRARAPEGAADRSQASEAGQRQVADGLPPSGEPGAALPETAPKTTLRVSDTTGTPKATPRVSDTAGSPRRARAPRSEARKGASSVRRTRWEPEPE